MYKNFVLVLLFILFLAQNSYAKVPIAGDTAPNFSLTTVDGKKITLSALKGKVVLMGMFHICVPCMKQALEFNKVQAQFSSKKLAKYSCSYWFSVGIKKTFFFNTAKSMIDE